MSSNAAKYEVADDFVAVVLEVPKVPSRPGAPVSLFLSILIKFSLKLIGSVMFGATFNLVRRVGLKKSLEHRKMIVFNSIAFLTTTTTKAFFITTFDKELMPFWKTFL